MTRWFPCIAFVLLATLGLASDYYQQLERRIHDLPPEMATPVLRQALGQDDEFAGLLKELPGSAEELRNIIALRAVAERAASTSGEWSKRAAERKKGNPLYTDANKDKEGSNWLGKAYQKLGEMIERWLRGRDRDMPNIGPVAPAFGSWLSVFAWIILGLLLVGLLYLVVRHFSWKATLKRKGALLDDEEPERTLDEWLHLADEHERNGRFREAIRCLYLACLMKFDEHNVARFDRGQTNWEHLERIQKSPMKPPSVDFVLPTRLFDRVWYGMRTEGAPDVSQMRAFYRHILDGLRGAR